MIAFDAALQLFAPNAALCQNVALGNESRANMQLYWSSHSRFYRCCALRWMDHAAFQLLASGNMPTSREHRINLI